MIDLGVGVPIKLLNVSKKIMQLHISLLQY